MAFKNGLPRKLNRNHWITKEAQSTAAVESQVVTMVLGAHILVIVIETKEWLSRYILAVVVTAYFEQRHVHSMVGHQEIQRECMKRSKYF